MHGSAALKPRMRRIARYGVLLMLTGCMHQPPPQPAPQSAPPAPASPAPAVPAPTAVPAPPAEPATAAPSQLPPAGDASAASPAREAPNPSAAPPAPKRAAKPAPPPATAASKPAAPAIAPNPSTPAAASQVAPEAPSGAPAAPPLDLTSLEQRLRDTRAIGVFTKLSLKNQVDDLLAQLRAYHHGQPKPPLTALRQRYELLLLKVVSLLQDGDAQLASAVSSSRDAIWGILADPRKFAQI